MSTVTGPFCPVNIFSLSYFFRLSYKVLAGCFHIYRLRTDSSKFDSATFESFAFSLSSASQRAVDCILFIHFTSLHFPSLVSILEPTSRSTAPIPRHCLNPIALPASRSNRPSSSLSLPQSSPALLSFSTFLSIVTPQDNSLSPFPSFF
eukprot:749813-Hanusia_phi.AAC.2